MSRTEALVCESMSDKQLLRLQQCACIYMSLCMQVCVCLYECLMHFVYLCVCVCVCACVCVCQIAGWGQRANQTQQNKKQNKTTNGIIMADILKNKHKLYRDSILFW